MRRLEFQRKGRSSLGLPFSVHELVNGGSPNSSRIRVRAGENDRLDMSEFMNVEAVGLLIGSPSDSEEVRRGLLGKYYDRT